MDLVKRILDLEANSSSADVFQLIRHAKEEINLKDIRKLVKSSYSESIAGMSIIDFRGRNNNWDAEYLAIIRNKIVETHTCESQQEKNLFQYACHLLIWNEQIIKKTIPCFDAKSYLEEFNFFEEFSETYTHISQPHILKANN